MKQAQGSKVQRLARSPQGTGQATGSRVLCFQYPGFSQHASSSVLCQHLMAFAQFAGRLLCIPHQAVPHRDFSSGAVDPEQGRKESPRYGRESFTSDLSAVGQCGLTMYLPPLAGFLKKFLLSTSGRIMVDKVSWQLKVKKDKWAQK